MQKQMIAILDLRRKDFLVFIRPAMRIYDMLFNQGKGKTMADNPDGSKYPEHRLYEQEFGFIFQLVRSYPHLRNPATSQTVEGWLTKL